MNLQNGYKTLYAVAADGKRTFYATKDTTCNIATDAEICTATIGEYKLIYEKDGQIYGSTSGVPADGDHCFEDFNKIFKVVEEPVTPATEKPATNTRRARKTEPVVEEPVAEEPAVEESTEIAAE